MPDTQAYFLRRIEETGGYSSRSFSNRYMNLRRINDLEDSFYREIFVGCRSGNPVRVLEIGCGDGWLIYDLMARFGKRFALDFTGIDLSEFDIDFAIHRKEYFKLRGCDFRLMEADRLEFPAGSFDIVVTSELVEHVPEPSVVISEAWRILKPGGLLIVTTPNGGGSFIVKVWQLLNVLSFGFLRKMFERVSGAQSLDSEAHFLSSSSASKDGDIRFDHVSVKACSAWIKIFKGAGFKIQRARGTGGLVLGAPLLDRHPILFALVIIMDTLLKILPLSFLWSETLFFECRKLKVVR